MGGVEMRLKMLVVDTGGEAGATDKAYEWYRRVRQAGMASRVRLYKGSTVKNAPIVKETRVGNRNGKEKADINLTWGNPNLLSDAVDAGLKREVPGPGYIHFPKWLPQSFFDELAAEVRDKNGVWRQIRKRNETFDLCRMIRVGMIALGLDKVRDWDKVPDWLKPLEANSEAITSQARRDMQEAAARDDTPIAAPTVGRYRPPVRERRVSTSAYLR
jgi:phage terminase large subunit GpA-like protein